MRVGQHEQNTCSLNRFIVAQLPGSTYMLDSLSYSSFVPS